MKLPADPLDCDAQDTALYAAISDPHETAFYFDTSVLVWLYRITRAARTELFDWASSEVLNDKMHIPAWAAHELSKHRLSKDVLFPIQKKASNLKRQIESLMSDAKLIVDDARARAGTYHDRATYLADLETATANMRKAISVLSNKAQAEAVEAEMLGFIETHGLLANWGSFSAMREEYLARSEARMPPGYKDLKKRGDDPEDENSDGANRFGDYVFWNEILTHARADGISKAVVITHDQKIDWVFKPSNYIRGGRTKSNDNKQRLVTTPNPTLSAEIRAKSNVSELYIVTIYQLIELMSLKGESASFRALAAALQIEEEAAQIAIGVVVSTNVEDPDQTVNEGEAIAGHEDAAQAPAVAEPVIENEPAEVIAPVAVDLPPVLPVVANNEPLDETEQLRQRLMALPENVLADGQFQVPANHSSQAIQLIDDLKSANWYRQNPAVLSVKRLIAIDVVEDPHIFLMGRNIYQAACGNAYEAQQFLTNLRRYGALPAFEDSEKFAQYAVLMAGIIFEVYFGPGGKIRSAPKDDLLDEVYFACDTPKLAPVTGWLRQMLGEFATRFIALPGGGTDPVILNVEIVDSRMTGISYGGVEITEPETDQNGLGNEALPEAFNEARLIKLLAGHFSIPVSLVRLEPSWVDQMGRTAIQLRTWSPTGELQFGGQ